MLSQTIFTGVCHRSSATAIVRVVNGKPWATFRYDGGIEDDYDRAELSEVARLMRENGEEPLARLMTSALMSMCD